MVVALVTGANQGIGRAVVELARDPARARCHGVFVRSQSRTSRAGRRGSSGCDARLILDVADTTEALATLRS